MRRKDIHLLLVCVFVIGLLPVSCSAWRQVSVRFTEKELAARICENFPITKTYLLLFVITYANPRISLQEGGDRVRLGLDASVNLGGSEEGGLLQGTIDMTAGVAYDQAKRALYLADPEIERMTVSELPDHYADLLREFSIPAVEEMFRRTPIYRLKPGGFKKDIAALLIKDVKISNGQLEIVFGV